MFATPTLLRNQKRVSTFQIMVVRRMRDRRVKTIIPQVLYTATKIKRQDSNPRRGRFLLSVFPQVRESVRRPSDRCLSILCLSSRNNETGCGTMGENFSGSRRATDVLFPRVKRLSCLTTHTCRSPSFQSPNSVDDARHDCGADKIARNKG